MHCIELSKVSFYFLADFFLMIFNLSSIATLIQLLIVYPAPGLIALSRLTSSWIAAFISSCTLIYMPLLSAAGWLGMINHPPVYHSIASVYQVIYTFDKPFTWPVCVPINLAVITRPRNGQTKITQKLPDYYPIIALTLYILGMVLYDQSTI